MSYIVLSLFIAVIAIGIFAYIDGWQLAACWRVKANDAEWISWHIGRSDKATCS